VRSPAPRADDAGVESSLSGLSRYFARIASTGEPRVRDRAGGGSEPAALSGRARRTYWYATMLVAQSGSTTSAGRGRSKRMRLSANCGSATCSMQRRQ
jgi:hypothetical protein